MICIGENVREERLRQGLSQEELAKKAGFSGKSMICHIEKNDRGGNTLKTVEKIAIALRVSPFSLMTIK